MGSVKAEGVRNPPDGALPIDEHDIETGAGRAPAGVFPQQDFRRPHQPGLLARPKRCRRTCQGGPRFHFDKGDQPILFRHSIYLPRLGSDTAAENRPAIRGERQADLVFGGNAGSCVGGAGNAGHWMLPGGNAGGR